MARRNLPADATHGEQVTLANHFGRYITFELIGCIAVAKCSRDQITGKNVPHDASPNFQALVVAETQNFREKQVADLRRAMEILDACHPLNGHGMSGEAMLHEVLVNWVIIHS
jgi:hypothetical protein